MKGNRQINKKGCARTSAGDPAIWEFDYFNPQPLTPEV